MEKGFEVNIYSKDGAILLRYRTLHLPSPGHFLSFESKHCYKNSRYCAVTYYKVRVIEIEHVIGDNYSSLDVKYQGSLVNIIVDVNLEGHEDE